ncbi:MAG: NAD-dependent epimerase/dehydratase family protein, partial [Bdellovibrionales bacterium]
MTGYRGKRVLVTGGAGFIGSHLVPKLLEVGARVRVADNLSRGLRSNLAPVSSQIEFQETDLTIERACKEACENQEIIFHLASKVGGIGYYMNKPAEVFENNITMDTLLFRAAQRAKTGKFIFASSAHVYPKRLQSSEDSAARRESDAEPAEPAFSYGWGKLGTEKMIQFRQVEGTNKRTAVLIIVGAFGELQDISLETGSVIPVLCRRAIEYPGRKPFTHLGQGLETRSYCYVGDVVSGLMAA